MITMEVLLGVFSCLVGLVFFMLFFIGFGHSWHIIEGLCWRADPILLALKNLTYLLRFIRSTVAGDLHLLVSLKDRF